ncbi:MAG: cell division protein ZapE, partial [Boseongicola sp.]|nr:cell division protein ZapE [Boseongicola sp.]
MFLLPVMGAVRNAYEKQVAAGALKRDPAQDAVLRALDEISDALRRAPQKAGGLGWVFAKKSEPVKGAYIWGGVGRGKSMLMDMFHDHVSIEGTRRVHFHAFMQEVQSALHEARKTGVDDAILPVARDLTKDLRLLCLDEMQITDIADAMIVGRLFEYMFERGVTVVTTSNRIPSDLYKDGLNRALFLPFIDLITEKLTVIELKSPTDHRQNRLEGTRTYFHPATSEAKSALDDIWSDLSGGQTEPLTLV